MIKGLMGEALLLVVKKVQHARETVQRFLVLNKNDLNCIAVAGGLLGGPKYPV